MATLTTGTFTNSAKDVFTNVVTDRFNNTSREAILEAKSMYKMLKTGKLFERTGRWAGLPRGIEIAEGGEIPIYSPLIGATKDYTVSPYGLGFRVSWLFKKTEQWNVVSELTTNLKMTQLELKEVELAKLWNTPTDVYTGYGGALHLAEASQTCLDASTYDNLLSAAPSVTAFESALYYFNTLKDDQGNTMFAKPDTIYFEPTLYPTMMEILKSEGKWDEDSNTTNIFRGWANPFMYHYLTSATAWGVLAKNHRNYDVRCYTLSEPDVVTQDAPDNTRDTIVTSMQAFSFGFGHPGLVLCGNT
jgi:hypothetical protein